MPDTLSVTGADLTGTSDKVIMRAQFHQSRERRRKIPRQHTYSSERESRSPGRRVKYMPFFKTRGAPVRGIDAHLGDVKADLHRSGMVRDFIGAALMNSGFGFRQAGELRAVKPSGPTADTKTRRDRHRREVPRPHSPNLLRPQAL